MDMILLTWFIYMYLYIYILKCNAVYVCMLACMYVHVYIYISVCVDYTCANVIYCACTCIQKIVFVWLFFLLMMATRYRWYPPLTNTSKQTLVDGVQHAFTSYSECQTCAKQSGSLKDRRIPQKVSRAEYFIATTSCCRMSDIHLIFISDSYGPVVFVPSKKRLKKTHRCSDPPAALKPLQGPWAPPACRYPQTKLVWFCDESYLGQVGLQPQEPWQFHSSGWPFFSFMWDFWDLWLLSNLRDIPVRLGLPSAGVDPQFSPATVHDWNDHPRPFRFNKILFVLSWLPCMGKRTVAMENFRRKTAVFFHRFKGRLCTQTLQPGEHTLHR